MPANLSVKPSFILPLFLLLALLGSACGDAVGNPRVAATVGDTEILVADVQDAFLSVAGSDLYAQTAAQLGEAAAEEQERSAILTRMIVLAHVITVAEEAGVPVPTEADVQTEIDAFVQQLGGEAAFQQWMAENGFTESSLLEQGTIGLTIEAIVSNATNEIEVDPAEVQAIYDEQFGAPQVAQILLATEEEAQDVLDRLDDGELYEQLALELSLDPTSGAQGGVLSGVTPDQIGPEFAAAVAALELDEISEPVESTFGWHIIRLVPPRELDDALRADIEGFLREQSGAAVTETLFADLNAPGNVVVNPRFGRWNGFSQSVEFVDPLGRVEPAGGAAADGEAGGVVAPPANG